MMNINELIVTIMELGLKEVKHYRTDLALDIKTLIKADECGVEGTWLWYVGDRGTWLPMEIDKDLIYAIEHTGGGKALRYRISSKIVAGNDAQEDVVEWEIEEISQK